MKRTPLKRKTPLNKVSKKRASELARYGRLRLMYLEEFPLCEICKSSASVDIHHKMGRDGLRLNQTSWWMAVCRDCHTLAHADPKWAMGNGYSVSRISHK